MSKGERVSLKGETHIKWIVDEYKGLMADLIIDHLRTILLRWCSGKG